MKVSKEFKVGLLVVLGLLLLFIGVNFLKGGVIFGKAREFYAVFDNSSGLQASNEVQINGVKVGQVVSVGLHPTQNGKVLVKFSLDDDDIQIPHHSSVWLISSDILGTKALDIRMDTIARPEIVYYESGDTIQSHLELTLEEQINQEILPLKKKTEELIGSVEQIIVSVNAFWDTSAAYTIDESLYEVRDAIGTFSDLANNMSILINQETEKIDRLLSNFNEISENLAGKSEAISRTIDNMDTISTEIAQSNIKDVIGETKNTLTELNDVLGKVNEGEGTLGALLHSDSLYNGLVKTNHELMLLIDDLQTNPNKYIHFSLFGRKVKGVQLTSEEEDSLRKLLNTP